MFNSTKISELQQRIAALEAELSDATTQSATAQSALTEAQAELGRANTALAEQRTQHETALAEARTEADSRVQREVAEALAAVGVPESNLPGKQPAKQNGSDAYATALEQYNAIADAGERAKFYAAAIAPLLARPN